PEERSGTGGTAPRRAGRGGYRPAPRADRRDWGERYGSGAPGVVTAGWTPACGSHGGRIPAASPAPPSTSAPVPRSTRRRSGPGVLRVRQDEVGEGAADADAQQGVDPVRREGTERGRAAPRVRREVRVQAGRHLHAHPQDQVEHESGQREEGGAAQRPGEGAPRVPERRRDPPA